MLWTKLKRSIILAILLIVNFTVVKAVPFDLVTPKTKVTIIYGQGAPKLDSILAHLLAADIQRVTGYLPHVLTDVSKSQGNVIVIGGINSPLIRSLNDPFFRSLAGKWECYSFKVKTQPFKHIKQALVIAGSDSRGTAYGVFDLSKKIGVSPWYWWADVKPTLKKQLSLQLDNYTSTSPSVKYRGIFINDEDWGMQPWAAKTLEPETGDIGPKTYARMFELLLRLNANLIWPAMHPSTKPFFHYPGNRDVAAAYEIVIGSSHAEPMLRNNVGEWNEKTMGHFNYTTNKARVFDYWESRVKESSQINAIYSIGMRGVHDSGMEGVKSNQEAVPLLEGIIADERRLLQKYVNPDVTAVPQALTVYKEVLEIYDSNLKVPDDVTLVWPDDNYGYIQRLSNSTERKRKGGSGVYYHVSYWGRPHDYLWLATTHPALIQEEMTKAYALDARDIWVVNVGDLKPAEYQTQLFLDMAYRIDAFSTSSFSKKHLQDWISGLFGSAQAPAITEALWAYYQLAFERKPEYMGWSQTEPTTRVNPTAYNHLAYGDQAQSRVDQYEKIAQAVKAIAMTIPANRKDAFYELVEYPVVCASLMNQKYLYRDKAILYGKQGRLVATYYAESSKKAHQAIIQKTEYYNKQLAGGKWNYMMSMEPRDLPVFHQPAVPITPVRTSATWMAIPEGYPLSDSSLSISDNALSLPKFNRWSRRRYFLDVFLRQNKTVNYSIEPSAPWIKISQRQGTLVPIGSQSQQRIWIEVDWTKLTSRSELDGSITIKAADQTLKVNVHVNNQSIAGFENYKGFIEANGYLFMKAADYSTILNTTTRKWTVIDGLGTSGQSLEALPLNLPETVSRTDTSSIRRNPAVDYQFYTFDTKAAKVEIYTLPTSPINNAYGMRYAISLDNGPLTILDFKTVGRSDEWKQNVLSNSALRNILIPSLPAGQHTLSIYMIDPGVILDRIIIDLNKNQPFYGLLPSSNP